MKYKHGWVGAVCCFVLFVVVCLFLTMNMKGAFRAAGHPEIGLLFFTLPGAVASFCSHRREVIKPLLGAMLAAPCCLLLTRLFFTPTRSLWQEMAWLFSAVFWCALGALCFLFISSLFRPRQRKTNNALRRGRYDITHSTQANRFKFSFAQASKSVQPPMCF